MIFVDENFKANTLAKNNFFETEMFILAFGLISE